MNTKYLFSEPTQGQALLTTRKVSPPRLSQSKTWVGFINSNSSMSKVLSQKFFNRNALKVAKELIGKYLVVKIKNKEKAYMITEVEAYDGTEDKACHVYKGKTERNKVMFDSPGHWYVYFIYGMYWMLNIVTGPGEYPSAVLIRKVENLNGPGKLTRDLKIDGRVNSKPADKKTGLWIEDRGEIKQIVNGEWQIIQAPRVGVQYAEEWANKPYRFILLTN